MNFYPFITFSKLFLWSHAKTSRTQRHFTCMGRADCYLRRPLVADGGMAFG